MKQTNLARRQRHWDLRAAGNFIGGGTGSGLVVASALAALAGKASGIAMAAGAAFVAMGLICVWLEIGKPWRSLNVFLHPQTSWMTREGMLAGPLVACSIAAAVLGAAWLTGLGGLMAAGYLYCQARILRASRAIPAWSHPRTVPLIISTGLAEGAGAWLVLAGPVQPMVAAVLMLALVREVARAAYRRGLIAAGAPAGTLDWFRRPETRVLQVLRAAAMLLLAAGLAGFDAAAVAGGALVVLTGWGLKAILITRAGYLRGAVILRTPARGRGPTHEIGSQAHDANARV
jgi:phenylacetyl-CoA:acceptor oxidoreductase 26-kDa subunit